MMPRHQEDSQLHYFGANSSVVAEISEVERVGSTLRAAGSLIAHTRDEISVAWIQDAVQLMQLAALRNALDRVCEVAEALATDCDAAASTYISAESSALGMFARFADSFPLNPQLRGLLTASLGTAAAATLGTSTGGLTLRAMTSTVVPNQGAGDMPAVAKAFTSAIAGTGLSTVRESATANKLSEFESACPRDPAELAGRLSSLSQTDEPLMRIDAVTTAAGRTLFVYLPGTQTWGLGGPNPLDMQSNVLAISGPGLAASEAAAVAALGQVRFDAADELVLVGHSQGALVAKNLAETYAPQVRGLVTFGAPILASQLPQVPALVFEHTNDPVPSLAGIETKYPKHAMTISRQFPDSAGFESHHMLSYYETASRATTDQEPQFVEMQRQMGFGERSSVAKCQSHLFQIQRKDTD